MRLLSAILLILVVDAHGATLLVRDGGDGSTPTASWAGAYDQLTTAIAAASRGDTIYVADGSYLGFDASTAVSGTTLITIKKAIESDHGVSTGWQTSYGDGTDANGAVFTTAIDFSTSYWVFDGQVGGGPGSWNSGFGFLLDGATDWRTTTAASNLQIKHFKVSGGGDGTDEGGFILGFGASNYPTDITFSYCASDLSGSTHIFGSGSDITWEYSYFGQFESTELSHAEVASLDEHGTGIQPTRWIFRWCVLGHFEGTGGIIMDGDDLKVYGCVFADITGTSEGSGNGWVGTWTGETITNLKVYNCTFIAHAVNSVGVLNANDDGEFKNNLLYITGLGSGYTELTRSHNHYVDVSGTPVGESNETTGTGNPFSSTSLNNANFAKLTANTTAGTDLGAPYNVDMSGNTRTTWTRGAIEFAEGGGTPTGTITFGGGRIERGGGRISFE